MKDDNIGQTGLESIRFDGHKIENLHLSKENEANRISTANKRLSY